MRSGRPLDRRSSECRSCRGIRTCAADVDRETSSDTVHERVGYDQDVMIAEFRGFLTKTNALALAVGVIIGAAVSSVVSALAADLLMPVIGLVLPGGDWRQAKYVLHTTTDAAGKPLESAILYGHFIGTLL